MDDRNAGPNMAGGILSLAAPLPEGTLHGTIHSVFDHACNLMFSRRMITVVQGDERMPDSVRLAPEAFVRLASAGKSTDIRLRGTDIAWNDVSIPLRADEWNGSIQQGAFAAADILRAVRDAGIPGLSLNAGPQASLRSAAKAILQRQSQQAHRILYRLIGLGQGLTPSADDAVVGILAALRRSDGIRFPLPAALLKRTTDVSAKYLRCAGQGFFSERVLAIMNADAGGLPKALKRAAEWGASSGGDMLHGIRMVCEIKCGQEG